jgi:drug/metabolite transporter (DMT)-like permease|tara:strand:+ start:1099 stop:1569 length:471 start_codon:yes stop_codon:yes gene_type:complete
MININNNLWIYLSLIVSFTTSLKIVCYKLLTKIELEKDVIVSIFYIFTGIFSLFYLIIKLLRKKENIYVINKKITNYYLSLLFILSVLTLFTTTMVFNALKMTPNSAYVHSIVNLNIIVTLIISYFYLNEKINIYTLIGILISLFGLLIISKFHNN